MLVTVLICTRNRSQQLAGVLNSMTGMKIPSQISWELIIINNGGTDNTLDTVRMFEGKLPIRHVFEPNPGLSNARNRGVQEAKGEYICWTDDDVIVGHDWLEAYVSAFRRHPDAAVFGGKVTPHLEAPTPRWITDNIASDILQNVFAGRDFGDEEIPLSVDDNRLPYGANFAVRAAEQKAVLYDPELGVSPDQRRLGEETKLIRSILNSGAEGWWVPDANVIHITQSSRQTEKYLKIYYKMVGETGAFIHNRGDKDNFMPPGKIMGNRFLAGIPFWVWREFIKNSFSFILDRAIKPPHVWLQSMKSASIFEGAIIFWIKNGFRRV